MSRTNPILKTLLSMCLSPLQLVIASWLKKNHSIPPAPIQSLYQIVTKRTSQIWVVFATYYIFYLDINNNISSSL